MVLELRYLFRVLRHPFEETTLCVMAKLKCAICGIVRDFVMVFGEPSWKSKVSGSANFDSGSILVPESIEKPERQFSEDKEEHERSGIAVSIDWIFECL